MLWLVLVLMVLPGTARAFDIDELMAMMGRVETSSVAFEETKHVAALTAPIVRRGTLRYVRPDRLEMHVVSPYFERMDIVGNVLTIETKRGVRQVDLAAEPGAAAWVAGIRATLAGDRSALARYFTLQLSGQAACWTLRLLPLDPALASVIQGITVDGAQAQLTRIEVDERMGDRTVLVVQPSLSNQGGSK
jgi:outer membrane lipoprotein-sorting protein